MVSLYIKLYFVEKNSGSNIYAIIGFVLSFFIPLAGFVVSIIWLKKSKELIDGRGLSIAGIIISSVWLFISLLIILFYIFIGIYIALY